MKSYPRKELARILSDYNKSIGNAVSISLDDRSSSFVVTGQQLGYMGGPAYTILKGITAILAARELKAIPLFWLATEDHDVAEIDHTYLLDDLGNIQRYRLSLPRTRIFVENLILQQKHLIEIDQFLAEAGLPDMISSLNLVVGMSYSQAMAKVLVRLFANTPLLFIEPYLLRPLAKDFFAKEIQESQRIAQLLKETAADPPLSSKGEGTNLFIKMEKNTRIKIRSHSSGFTVGTHKMTEKELLHLVESEPERFSTNVAARPILQSMLIPTIAYVAGPTETLYYKQLTEYHRFHQVPFPQLIPRISATLISKEAALYLDKLHLHAWDEIPDSWESILPGYSKWTRPKRTEKLKELELPSHALHYLRNLLVPQSSPQDRILNWLGFQGKTKENLVQRLLKTIDWKLANHNYIYVD